MYPEIDDRDNCDQNKSISVYIKFTDIIIGITILLGLYAISIYSYVLFHSLVEIFGIIVIVSISIIVLHSRRLIDNNYYIFVGIAYLFIAVMTLLHTLAYKGMGVFIGYDANLPTQLWIATRYLESLTFLIAPLFIGHKLKMNTIFSGYAIVTSFLIASIFYWNIFPDCFIEDVGLTAFKKVSEYVISLVLLFSIYLLFQKRSNFDKKVLNLLIVALMLNVFAELAFTFYISVYGASNLIGHFFRLISFYLIYKAIIETSLTKPYNLLFRSLKQSEMSLQSSSNFVHTIINSIGDPTIVIDASNYKILLANDAAQIFNNCKNPVEKSMACYQFSHQRDAPCSTHNHSCPFQQVINTKESQRVIHTHHDKKGNESIVDIVATPIFDKNGEVIQIIESTRDITEITMTEKVLRETRDYLEKVIEYTNAPFIMWDPEFKITRVNHAFEHLTGYCSEELTYKKLNMLFPDSSLQETMNEIDRTLVGKSWESVEIPILRKDGSIRLTLWNSANLYDEDDKTVLAIIAQGIDITERKEAEEKLKKYAEELEHSNELKDMFTDILRHDLLNPAGLVKGYTEVLFGMESDDKKLHVLQKIEQNNKKLIDLIESAAKYAKLESTDELEFNVDDIGTIIKDVVEDFEPMLYEKQITLDLVAEGTYYANVNPIIEEVFANLFSNAIKFSPTKSKIIVGIIDNGKKWKATVTDFGEGISDEDKPNVFTRFKRVGKGSVKGTGLGLAIVKKIIELHGGEVGVEDNPSGQGSVFWVTFRKG
ncbi:MAG: MASE3 domain-containing protein [Methanosarcinaceae archaeon]|nr:MASE3 domain-containing protein [Methanosarcinaceae archaeon]